MDEYLNCLLSICCPPLSESQHATFVKALLAHKVCDEETAWKVAKFMLANFDLAPQGSLQAFKDAIAKFARQP